MGRPKKPLALHVVQGTGRAASIEKRQNELILTPGPIGDPPAWFDDDMKTEWARVAKTLEVCLSPGHRVVVEHHCVLYKRFVEDATGGKSMSASERQTFHSIQMQLGATPASQSKVLKAPTEDKVDDPWSKFG